jgi:hypothetical protein
VVSLSAYGGWLGRYNSTWFVFAITGNLQPTAVNLRIYVKMSSSVYLKWMYRVLTIYDEV